jgi:hypothetical protein
MWHAGGTKKTTAREQLDGAGTDAEIKGCRLEQATARMARLMMTQLSLFWDDARLRHRNDGPKNSMTILFFWESKASCKPTLWIGINPARQTNSKPDQNCVHGE